MAGRRISPSAALAAALAAGSLLWPHLKSQEALGDGQGRMVYVDPVGVTTWCYGDTGPVPNTPLNEAVCSSQLTKRVREICTPVAAAITVPLYPHEMAAVCSWAYNVGETKARSSTLLKLLNQGKYAQVPDQFLRWHYAQGRDCKVRSNNCYGVWKRRLEEARIFRGETNP